METVPGAIADWIKEILTAAIMTNLSGLFDAVNTQVGEIAQQVGTSPANFEPRVFSMIRSVSNQAILPIAGVFLTLVACYELVQMAAALFAQYYAVRIHQKAELERQQAEKKASEKALHPEPTQDILRSFPPTHKLDIYIRAQQRYNFIEVTRWERFSATAIPILGASTRARTSESNTPKRCDGRVFWRKNLAGRCKIMA